MACSNDRLNRSAQLFLTQTTNNMKTNKTDNSPSIKDLVLAEYQKGNIVVAGVDGLQVMNLKEFIKQPADGILYDLNRNEVVVLTFIDDPKWVNDYAVCKTIQALKAELESLKKERDDLYLIAKEKNEEIARLKGEIQKRDFMIKEGLGCEDMKNDIKYPSGD